MPGSWPLAWAHQPKLVWAARTKEHLHSQLGICEEQPWDAGLCPDEGGKFIHMCNIIRLYCLAGAKPRGGKRKQHCGFRSSVYRFYRNKNRENASHLFISGNQRWSLVLVRGPRLFILHFVAFPKRPACRSHVDIPQYHAAAEKGLSIPVHQWK